MQIFLSLVIFNGLLLLTMYLEHTKRQVEVFFFPEMRLYFLMFITAIWFLLRPKWERFFKLSQEKVSGLMDHKAVWIR